MTVTPDFLQYVVEQLSGLGGVDSRRMFGGAGLYHDGLFFGLIADDVLYLKVNDVNRADYEREGMQAFRPYRDRDQVSISYFEVPVGVLEDQELLVMWARKSIAAAKEPSASSGRKTRFKTRRTVKM
jgi:DNA transformation protein